MKPLKVEDITILVDTREQLPFNFLRINPALKIERATLKTGDYSIKSLEKKICVERKSISDLVRCCAQDRTRFSLEIDRMLSIPSRALVLETTYEEIATGRYRSNVHPNAVIGSLMGWQSRGIPVITSTGPEAAARYALWFMWLAAKHIWEDARGLERD